MIPSRILPSLDLPRAPASPTRPRVLRRWFSLLPALVALPACCPAFEWTGAAGAAFNTPGSWAGPAPAANTLNIGDLFILNGSGAPLSYTEAEGATVFQCVDFKIGNSSKPGGALNISGGDLTVISRWAPMVGHNNNQTSTLTLTGGKLTFISRDDAKPEERNFRVGNGKAPNTTGVLMLSGGTLVVSTPGHPGLGGFIIACDNAVGQVLLTGGLLVVSSPHGTSFQPTGGRGIGTLTFGPGDGVFMQTDSKQISFGEGGGADSFINFRSGSGGQLSLNGASRADYEAWVKAGRIRLNGIPASPDKFRFLQLDTQGIYLLAPSR